MFCGAGKNPKLSENPRLVWLAVEASFTCSKEYQIKSWEPVEKPHVVAIKTEFGFVWLVNGGSLSRV